MEEELTSRPKPLMWVWVATRCFFVVDWTSSIFIFSIFLSFSLRFCTLQFAAADTEEKNALLKIEMKHKGREEEHEFTGPWPNPGLDT